ncbi:MAG: hypothetical protein QM490_01840 [Candidatus Gracilibacteria bacterium]
MKILKHDLNTDKTSEFELRATNKQYSVRGFNKQGVTNFSTAKQNVKFDDIIYYDIETVKIGQKFDNETFANLNLTYNIMYSFSLLIPKTKLFTAHINHLKQYYNNEFSEANKKIIDIQEKEDYYLLFLYSENTNNNLFDLVEILIRLRNRNNLVKVIGFNNNKFDDLIFKHLDNYNLFRNEKDKYNKLVIYLDNDKEVKINLYDIRDLSKTFRLNSLKDVGEYIGLDKLEIIDEKVKGFKEQANKYIEYNNRDNEILYYFLKDVNDDLAIFETNVARWSRKYFYHKMFEKLDVKFINSNGYINNFTLFGGRTEAYTHLSKNCKYIDFNSLYTSSRVVLDVVKPVIDEKIDKRGVKVKRANYFLSKLDMKSRIKSLITSFKIDLVENEVTNFTYLNLSKIYDKYSNDKFFMLNVKIKGIEELFEDKETLLKFYFPFVRKYKGKSTFSYSEDTIYEISFYEIIFLAFFDFEIIEAYSIGKGEDVLKDELVDIYENRKILQSNEDKKEALEKLKLNSGYGIYATRNRTSELILDDRLIKGLDKFLNRDENTLNYELKETIDNLEDNVYFSFGLEKFKVKIIGSEYFKITETEGKKWTDNSIPVLALNIVSNSRFMLYSLMLDYLMNSDNLSLKIHYCDTDSLFCDEDIYTRLKELDLIGNNLGQLKDELPDNKITELKCFAPKTYTYKLDDGTEKKVYKGTGANERRTVVAQSLKMKFNSFDRTALRPNQEQKRVLVDNIFYNKFGTSEKLVEVWNIQLDEYDRKKEEELNNKKGDITNE